MNRWPALDAAEDHLTKATLGITGWYCPSVHSDGSVRHLDVGSTYPGAGEGPKGMAVRHLKSYASWVQTVLRLIAKLVEVQFESLRVESFSFFVYEIKNRIPPTRKALAGETTISRRHNI